MRRAPWLLPLLAACAADAPGAAAPVVDASLPDATTDASLPDATTDAGLPDATTDAANRAPEIAAIGPQALAEDATLTLAIDVRDPDGDPLRVFASGLPPGARFDEPARRLTFRPDFLQGGGAPWTVTLFATDGRLSTTSAFTISVSDSIHPPEPQVAKTEDLGGCLRLTVSQRTDAYTDSAGYAGRSFGAVVVVPKGASATSRVPISLELHGAGGAPDATRGCGGEIQVMPHDPMTSYWWGFSEKLPGGAPTAGAVRPFTARRALQLLDWASRAYGGDPRRTYARGASMGGAGAMTLGLLWARHFACVDATIGQAIPRNHRPSRLATLEALWGTRAANLDDGAGMGVWDRQDLTRALRDEPEAAGLFLFLKHGKDDPTIHFGAVTIASPLTGRSLYGALATHPVYAAWDEGGHGPADPVMPDGWWDAGWNRVWDATSFVRTDLAVPAFSGSSLDGDPGDGTGNGKVAWSAESGFAGQLSVAGDTGFRGALAGAINRHLRWDATKIVDTRERFEIPLRVLDGAGQPPPRAGYPTVGDEVAGALPATVDVTLRRVQAFAVLPGEALRWSFGAASGSLVVGADGALTVKGLALGAAWTTLVLTRGA